MLKVYAVLRSTAETQRQSEQHCQSSIHNGSWQSCVTSREQLLLMLPLDA
jgi:hypothetical protein